MREADLGFVFIIYATVIIMQRFIRFILFCLLTSVGFASLAATTMDTPASLYYPTVNTIVGNPAGKITIVEFFDYRCVYCRHIPAIIADLLKKNPDVRVVYRDYPLLGPPSALAAEAALSAQQQGKYLQLHNALFTSKQPLDINVIKQLAAQQGIDAQKMEKAHLSYLTQQQLRENAQLANKLDVDGIPTIFVALTPLSTQRDTIEAYKLISPSLADLQNAINLLKEPA